MEEKSPVSASIIVPAHNEAAVIGKVVDGVFSVLKDLPGEFEIIVVDDGSTDGTGQIAAEAGARVIAHPYNIGNGAAVKTGLRAANGEIILLMDGDGQHRAEDIPRFLEEIGHYDMVVGARTRSSETAFHRDVANAIYNLFASYICNRRIEDLTSGFRAIRRTAAQGFIYLLPNTFSYPTTLTLAIIRAGYSLQYIPIVTNTRVGKSKINLLRDGVRFLNILLRIAIFFAPLRIFIPISAFMFLTGFGWYIYSVFFAGRGFPPTSSLLILASIIVFSIGLLSEQIAQLRYERTE